MSPSTFFRYFPTKEDVVFYDALDPLLIAAFEAQPPELSPTQALRGAMREVFSRLPPEEMEDMRRRMNLIASVPELRSHLLDEFTRNIQLLAALVAQRLGRSADELAVRAFAGALIGVVMALTLDAADDPAVDFLELMDAGLAQLEAGLPL